MQRKSLDVWVGLFVVLGAAALLFLALKAGNMSSISFGKTYDVTARFDNIGGLKPGAPVKSAGVVVGRVDNIGLNSKTFQAEVRLKMQNGYPFPKDSSAKILTSGLLGEQYIGLEPGGDTKGYVMGLAEMYVADERFAANYVGFEGASFVRDALMIHVKTMP